MASEAGDRARFLVLVPTLLSYIASMMLFFVPAYASLCFLVYRDVRAGRLSCQAFANGCVKLRRCICEHFSSKKAPLQFSLEHLHPSHCARLDPSDPERGWGAGTTAKAERFAHKCSMYIYDIVISWSMWHLSTAMWASDAPKLKPKGHKKVRLTEVRSGGQVGIGFEGQVACLGEVEP